MSTPKFAETHNLVTFLEKTRESNGFEDIIDFLNASFIKYALTVNPTVHESCIQQFWATAMAKTVNGERQIQALVDTKKVIITEKSVRSDLMLEYVEGIECLPNDVIFEQLTLMSAKTTAWNEFSSTMASAIICLATNQKFNFSKYIFDHMIKNLEEDLETHWKLVKAKHGNTWPEEDYERVLWGDLKVMFEPDIKSKIWRNLQAKEIASLKKRVKQLEKRKKSRTSGLKRLRKVGSASRGESSNDVSLGAQEDASKQGRKIANLDADAEVTLIDETQERYDEEIIVEKEVSLLNPITTAGEVVTTASATTTICCHNTLLVSVASTRPKAKRIVFHDQEEQASAFTPIVSSSQLPQAKDKGKGKMVELEKPLKKKDQIALDEELALKLHAEEQAELERMQKERVAQEEASRAAIIEELDRIQAMIEADEQLAARLQAKKQEQFSIKEKSRMLIEMIAERKIFFAAQQSKKMKGRSYEEIQKLFDKAYTQVNSFVPMDSEVVKSSETRTERSSKRA
ncbi:hypothetical protein Tco_0750201 [Tanacetum coccineum]|uniref:Uncharacterized protein n=1 Tax=Tanacetum coccineum TaxID=301880 RepID=A0ABQ4Z1K0_9ASTR